MTTQVHCYGARRLNPFLGVVQVVETAAARAFSMDGVSWQLQVLAERPEHTWGSLNRGRSRKQFFHFGLWQRETGMTRVPLNPVLDIGAMLHAGRALVEQLQQVAQTVPFPLADRHELWLLDRDALPLALLASTVAARFMPEVEAQQWRATLPAGEPFRAPSLEARGIAVHDADSRRRHAELLEQQVRDAAGRPPRRQWTLRADDGSGTALDDDGTPNPAAGAWQAAAFPPAGLRGTWLRPDQSALAEDYLDWLAPRLLTLPQLPEALHRRLERAAAAQALLVAANFRLYPRVLDPGIIDAARVEARLRDAAGAT
jgi:hypothetical protein